MCGFAVVISKKNKIQHRVLSTQSNQFSNCHIGRSQTLKLVYDWNTQR